MTDSNARKSPGTSEIAQFLRMIDGGEQLLTDDRLLAIATSLKAIIDSRPDKTADSNALIREALVATFGKGITTDIAGEQQFYLAGARAMRRFLVNQAHAKVLEPGASKSHAVFNESSTAKDAAWSDIIACHAAITELEKTDARMAQVAMLRYFGGLSEDECAIAVGRDRAAVCRQWLDAAKFLKDTLAKSA